MCIFAESVALNKLADPSKWLRCDGSAKLKNSYPELYEVCRDAFGPETDTTFTIPIMNNTIVRARQ
jgi:microcystin-dependent protein